jgi:hypothetical protein
MRQLLGRLDAMNDWAALATVLRRVLAGERDPDELTAGLDEIDTAIVQRALDALAGRITLTPAEASDAELAAPDSPQ